MGLSDWTRTSSGSGTQWGAIFFVSDDLSNVIHGILTWLWQNIVHKEAEIWEIYLKGNHQTLESPCMYLITDKSYWMLQMVIPFTQSWYSSITAGCKTKTGEKMTAKSPSHLWKDSRMAQEIISEIHIWSGTRWCHMSNSPGHLQHIQERYGKLFLISEYGPEQDHVMAIIVQDIYSTSRNGLGNVLVIFIWSGARLCYGSSGPGHLWNM